MKQQLITAATLEIELPDYNRAAFTDMLVAGENIVPWTNRSLLIDEPFFYSHEWDVEEALTGYLNHEWGKRKYALAVSEAEFLREEFRNEENIDKLLESCDADSIFKRCFKLEMRRIRISANIDIARCWVKLLKQHPKYVKRCPWHFFQGDRIWQTLQDEEFLKAIKHTPLHVARKMNLNAMSSADWDEVLKIIPELASRRPKNDYVCIVE